MSVTMTVTELKLELERLEKTGLGNHIVMVRTTKGNKEYACSFSYSSLQEIVQINCTLDIEDD